MPAKPLIVVLLLIRTTVLFFGLDRLPMVPTVQPEVLINDPAVALSRGYGYTAYSFVHSVNGLDRIYAFFPPVFIGLQSLIFRALGFSSITLRLSSVVADLFCCIVFVAILRELHSRGIVDRAAFILAAGLILIEPTTLFHAREARMESLNVLLGAIAVYCCLRADREPRWRLGLWYGAACCIGLALASHLASVIFAVAFTIWSIMRFPGLGFRHWISLNILPPLILLVIWLGTYKTRALEALRQLEGVTRGAEPPSLRIADLIRGVTHHDMTAVENAGGLGLVLILLSLLLGCARLLQTRSHPPVVASAEWWPCLAGFTAIVMAQCALLQFVVPTSGVNRAVMMIPSSLICAAIALSWPGMTLRQLTLVGAAAVFALEAAVLITIPAQLRGNWSERSAGRFDAVVEAIPPHAKVAAVSEWWFALQSHHHPFSLIFHSSDEWKYWDQTPAAFDPYDVVILDPLAAEYPALFARVCIGRPVQRLVHTYRRDYMVVARTLNESIASR